MFFFDCSLSSVDGCIISKKGMHIFGFWVNSDLPRTVYFHVIQHCLEKSFCNNWMNSKLKCKVP